MTGRKRRHVTTVRDRSQWSQWLRCTGIEIVGGVCVALLALTGGTAVAASLVEQVGVGAPPITGVGQPPDVSTPTTSSGIAPVPVMGASSTTSAVLAGPSTSTVAPVSASTSSSTTVGDTAATAVTSTTGVTNTVRPGRATTTRPPADSIDDLRTRVGTALGGSTSARMGVYVTIDGNGPVLFERNAQRGLIPASTQKMYVAGAALSAMGPDARYSTEVFADGQISNGVVNGDLVLRASGDPTFGATQLAVLATSVKSSGATRISGSLVLDDSRYDRLTRIASWKAAFTPGESGWLSAFSVDGNHRNDSATLADPALANLERFRAALAAKGVTVSGASRRGAVPPSATLLGSSKSAPLAEIVQRFVKRSDNTYAELLTKEIGARLGIGSTANGLSAIARHFGQLEVPPPEVQEDGSGLSSNNRSSARTQVAYLPRALASPIGAALRDSLAVSCVDGTLRSRTCGTVAAGKVLAKSGAIDNVVALSGVTTTASGRAVTFSFLLNDVRSPRLGRAAIDAALVEVVRSTV